MTNEQRRALADELISALTGLSIGDAEYSAVRRRTLSILATHDQPPAPPTDHARAAADKIFASLITCDDFNPDPATLKAMGLVRGASWNAIIADAIAESERPLVEALEPFKVFTERFERKPLRGTDDVLYQIHSDPEDTAAIRLSDCQRARAALAGRGRG